MQTTTPSMIPVRRKSRRRWYLFGSLALLLAVPIAYYFIAGWWSERQMAELTAAIDAEDPHWKWPDVLNQIEPLPDEENSAVQIAKVRALLHEKNPLSLGGKWENYDSGKHGNARWPKEYLEPLRTSFAGVPKEAVAEARKLKDMPAGSVKLPAEDNPFALKLDHVQHSREIANLLQWDAVLRAQDGDMEGAAESCRAILNTARAWKNEPFLIGQLVRIAEQAIAVANIERTLGQGTVSDANLLKLQTLLEAESCDDALHQAMRGERASGHQAYLNLRSGKLTISELLGPPNVKPGISERLLDTFPGILLNGYPEYLRLMNEQVRISKMKDAERADAFAKLEQEVRKNRTNLLITMIMPATVKVAEAAQRTQANLRCAIAAIAVERYRLSHNNTWPRNLDEVVKAGLLKEVPKDPYDGQPLRFKRTATGVVIYSVNIDKIDNGGKRDRNNLRAPGTDLGFELWDAKLRGVAPPAIEEGK